MLDFLGEQPLLELLSCRERNMFEQATAMQLLCKKYSHTQATLAKKLGVSQSYIGNKIRLLQFSQQEREHILKYALSERHARVLLRTEPPKRRKLITTVGNLHLTVQQTEELVDKHCMTHELDIKNTTFENNVSANTYLLQVQAGAERLRAVGYKTTYMTESGENWQRITVTIIE